MTSEDDFKWYVVRSGNDIKGYMWVQLKKEEVVVREANVLDEKAARVACNNEIYPGTWAGMYRIINLKGALEVLIPSFEKRLSNSRFYDYTKAYKISTDIGEVVIQMKHGKVKILDNGESDSTIGIASRVLTQLLTGYKDLSYFEGKINFNSEKEKSVLKVLFPLEFPYIYDLEYSDEL